MGCNYCDDIRKTLEKYNTKRYLEAMEIKGTSGVNISELYWENGGHDSGYDIPINYCPNCGRKIIEN